MTNPISEARKIIAQTERSLERAVVASDRNATICWGYYRLKEIIEEKQNDQG